MLQQDCTDQQGGDRRIGEGSGVEEKTVMRAPASRHGGHPPAMRR